MANLTEWTITNLQYYGTPVLVLLSFIGSLGIPFPNTFIVVAAGALAHLGILDWRLVILACLLGTSLADSSEYLLGHLAHPWLEKHFGHKPAWQKAKKIIDEKGQWAIVLTRFWLIPLAPAVNFLSGTKSSYFNFLVFDLLGQFIWVMIYGGVGFFFASQRENIYHSLSIFTELSFVAFMVAIAGYFITMRFKSKENVEA